MKYLFSVIVSSLMCMSASCVEDSLPYFSKAIEDFQQNRGDQIGSHSQHFQMDQIHYYGIKVDKQMQVEGDFYQSIDKTRGYYRDLKAQILEKMGLSSNTTITQVIGDSSPFSLEKTEAAKRFLNEHISGDEAILYGYTGLFLNDGRRCVNALVSDVIKEREWVDRTIGNLVGFHTPLALKEWGCRGPNLKHYVVVFSSQEASAENGTVFGDDIVTSDFLSDRLLVLEGGVQSFQQICHALLLNQKIDALSDLRSMDQTHFTESDGSKTPYFSATKFLKDLSAFSSDRGDFLSDKELNQWYQNYFGPNKCYVANPAKQNFEQRQKALDDAWELFVLLDLLHSICCFPRLLK